MSGRGETGDPTLLDLVEPPRWQRLQDHFAHVLGVAIRTVEPSHQLTVNPSWPSGFSPEHAIRLLHIGDELDPLLPPGQLPQDTSSLTTPLGITYAAIPIRATAEQILAYFVVGPMMVGPREDELQFRQRVDALGLDAQALWPLVLSLKLYTFAGIRSALNLMEEVGAAVVQLAYQARQLATILPATSKVDHAVIAYHTDRILYALLEAATLATKAEGGSVMVYDAQREVLQIKVAQGLSDTVIANTRLKRGEGLAGLAVSEGSILLVDDQTTEARLQQRMGRQQLASALIAPLASDARSEPIGVLNLRTSNPQRRFTAEHVELLRRLLDLAGAALGSLRFALKQSPPSASPHSA